MSNGFDGGGEFPSDGNSDFVTQNPILASVSADDSDARSMFDLVASAASADRVSVPDADRSIEGKDSYIEKESGAVKIENAESGLGDGSGGALDNHPASSVDDKTELKAAKPLMEDYDSMLSEFDHYASKGAGDAVGYGYEIGDMVWGKVKSHPWWPGYIYNEEFASPTVSKAKRSGHVLVAFFGDGSYGWFELAELVPFAENFAEKSRQAASRGFLKAVEEAVGEFSRRRSLALACRCRNEFNFWPSKVEGYYAVDVGDFEPGVYSLSQINKSRENFEPKEMLSFIDQLALKPKTSQHVTIEFIKNKATVLACRRAIYEEFDETYAQAFGSSPERPSRPNMPLAVDPAKAPLYGPLVFAEALGKGKGSAKAAKMKEPVEDKYIFKRRDDPVPMNIKKPSAGQASAPAQPFLVDGSGLTGMLMESSTKGHLFQTSVSVIDDNQIQAISHRSTIASDAKPLEGFRKITEGGTKKVKSKKKLAGEPGTEAAAPVEKEKKRKKDTSADRPAGELTSAIINPVEMKKKKKRKKEITNEIASALGPLPVVSSEVASERVSGMLVDIPVLVNNQLDAQKDTVMSSFSSPITEKQLGSDGRKLEFSMLVKDLQALALNPYHGDERGCPATAKRVFLKFRSLVYQKSLVLFPSETDKSESNTVCTGARAPTDKPKDKLKLTKPLSRPNDPTKGGKKRGPSDLPESAKKKKVDESQEIEKKKRADSEGIKKKKIMGDSKSASVEKKIPQKPTEIRRENMKTITSKNVSSLKGGKPETSKRLDLPAARTPDKPTMLVLKFPTGAALPSATELRAKFTRFGRMDHKATRVFWKSSTCRLVFLKKADAEDALKYTLGTNNLFGNTNVRSYIRDVEVEAPEAGPRGEDPLLSEPIPRTAAKVGVQVHQQPNTQLKSCLKKPGGEEGDGNGNSSNGRGGTRVKFVLGGEGNSKSEQMSSISSSYATTTHSSTLDVSSSGVKNVAKLIPQSSGTSSTTSTTTAPAATTRHYHHHELPRFHQIGGFGGSRGSSSSSSSSSNNDISRQFLNLLTRCNDVVNTLSGALGYVPYHSL